MTFAEQPRFVPSAPANEVLYAQMKLEWKGANRGCSCAEYDAAITLIAELCGV